MEEKKLTLFVNIEGEGGMLSGNVDETLEFLRSYLEELENKDVMDLQIWREDMTEKEIEALPED